MNRLRTWQLFAICVLVWGTTWYAITFQISATPPALAVALRFALAGGVVLAICLLLHLPLRFGWRMHGLLALQGVFLYGVSYVCVYYAEQHLVSGVVAVGYSASPLVTGIGAHFLFGQRLGRRFLAGGVAGLCGVALIFWPEIARTQGTQGALLGGLFTVLSVALSAVGSLTASRNKVRGIPFWPALGFGMLYGAAASAAVALALGQGAAWQLPTAPSWYLALAWLALLGSVLTFACFLRLQERIGPGPTGAIGVMTPLLALGISVLFEHYAPGRVTLLGALLAVAGNYLMLTPPATARGAAADDLRL